MGQPQALRRQNRQQIMELLLQHGTLTRPQLAERSGLSKVTVNAIVQELQEHQWVNLLDGSSTQHLGRVPQFVALHPRLGGVMGLDIQRQAKLFKYQDLSGQITHSGQLKGQTGLNDQLLRFIQEFAQQQAISTVVMGVPAPVESNGRLAEPNALPELEPAGLQGALQAQHTQVFFENDANLAALAAAQHYPEFGHLAVLLQRESGTGLGLILRGELYRGATGRAGELGHTPAPAGDTPLEQLPEPHRTEATAYALAGLAHTLDLQLVVIGCTAGGNDLASRTAALLPAGCQIRVEVSCAELVRDGATILATSLGREALLLGLHKLSGSSGFSTEGLDKEDTEHVA